MTKTSTPSIDADEKMSDSTEETSTISSFDDFITDVIEEIGPDFTLDADTEHEAAIRQSTTHLYECCCTNTCSATAHTQRPGGHPPICGICFNAESTPE